MTSLQLNVTDPKHIEQPAETSSRYSDAQKAKIANAAKEFEGLLTEMMLKSMNKTSGGLFGGGSNDSGFGGDYFNMIFENQMAEMISKKKSLGIADVLYKKITGEDLEQNLKKPEGTLPLNLDKIEINKSVENLPAVSPNVKALDRLGKYENIIDQAAGYYRVDKNLIKSVILTESAANEKAVSSAKAKGLMQLIDSTAADMGVGNAFDPRENIFGGTKYLSEMLRKYDGNVKLALASYNAGPQNVDKYGGVPPFDETQTYVKRVIGYLNHFNGENYGND